MKTAAEPSSGGDAGLAKVFSWLGKRAASRPAWIIGFWACLSALAFFGARRAPQLLFSGTGDIAHSESSRADSLLRTDFENPYSQLLALTLKGNPDKADEGGDEGDPLLGEVEHALSRLPQVRRVMTRDNVLDKRLLPRPGSGDLVLIGLNAETARQAEEMLPKVRATVDSCLGKYRKTLPGLEWAVTGRAALNYDFNRFNADDSLQAERRAIPLAIVVLILTFGSLIAAGIPLLLGILSTTLNMGMIFVLAHYCKFSNLIQNASGMIGMAVGIDYSLLFIHRYREILAAKLAGYAGRRPDRAQRGEALAQCMTTAGKTILYSGLTVMIGFLGLTFTPIVETRSIGWGGCFVVFISMLLALSLLPALLVLSGSALDWPLAWSRRLAGKGPSPKWQAWSGWVMRRAPTSVAIGLLVVLVLSFPSRYTRFGLPEGPFIPKEMEFTRGYAMLRDMGLQGVVAPINVILTSVNGNLALDSGRVPSLYRFSRLIFAQPGVAHIFGPVDLGDSVTLAKYMTLYADMDNAMQSVPFVKDYFLSRDGRSLLMQVMLQPDIPLEAAKQLAKAISRMPLPSGMTAHVGGQAVQTNDFDEAMKSAYKPSIFFVLGVTFATMLIIFRSPLVSLKALFMNAFSVAAGYGVVVFTLQLGHGHALLGSPSAAQVVPLTVPLMMFCIMFGLSMDYEVFLLSRIRESYLKSRDNEGSVAEGLAATGSVITSAASIMVAVFGAFAFSRMIIVQMLGLGLGVAVLVDATIIRILLAPALMKLAGKWNWWPCARLRPET